MIGPFRLKSVLLARRTVAQGIVILFVLPVVFLLRPFVTVRLVHLYTARLGHLALNTHQYLANRLVPGPEKRAWHLFFGAAPCNRQLFTMYKRRIPIIESRVVSALYHYLGEDSWVRRLACFSPLPTANARHRAIAVAGPVLSFSNEEKRQGAELLLSMGLAPNDWFVCFQSRDPAFHIKRGAGGDNKQHRNCRIETFLKAAQYIADRGGYAIRIGSTAESRLPEGLSRRVIDYTNKFRSDFGDIYLLGNCRFLLGSSTGTTAIPSLFGLPVASTNNFPMHFNPVGPRSLIIPKILLGTNGKGPIPFSDLAKLGAFSYRAENVHKWDNFDFYRRLGCEIVDNNEDDILDLCLDMFDRIEGHAPPGDSAELQRLFKRRFLAPQTDEYEYTPDIGPRFALKYRYLIEN